MAQIQLRSWDVHAALETGPRAHLLRRSWRDTPAILADMLEGSLLAMGYRVVDRRPPRTVWGVLAAALAREACVPSRARVDIRCAALARELCRAQVMRDSGPMAMLRYAVSPRWRWVVEIQILTEQTRALCSAGCPRDVVMQEARAAWRDVAGSPRLHRIAYRIRSDLTTDDVVHHVIHLAMGEACLTPLAAAINRP